MRVRDERVSNERVRDKIVYDDRVRDERVSYESKRGESVTKRNLNLSSKVIPFLGHIYQRNIRLLRLLPQHHIVLLKLFDILRHLHFKKGKGQMKPAVNVWKERERKKEMKKKKRR